MALEAVKRPRKAKRPSIYGKRPGQFLPDDPMWIVGSIDAYRAIHARVVEGYASTTHTPAESIGKRWRWNIWQQEYTATRNASHERLTDEEYMVISDWLERKGYKWRE